MKGSKVLITGGLGFIGSNLAHRCLDLGAEVTVYDSLAPYSGGNLLNVKGIEKHLRIIRNDILNVKEINSCIKAHQILFNCAAHTSHLNSMKECFIDTEVNCKGFLSILEAARRFNPEIKIVQVGTSTQIGKMQFNPIDESHPEFPLDIYSANKAVAEKYALIYGNAYGIQISAVRLGNVYGPRSNIKSPDFGFINYFIGLAIQDKDVPVFGSGNQLRNILFVKDAVEALVLVGLEKKCNGHVLFAVADQHYSVLEIARNITKTMGGRIKKVEWPQASEAIEVGNTIITNEKIKEMLPWQPQVGLEAGLKITKDYFSNGPPGISTGMLNEPLSIRMKTSSKLST
jgi:UDP-glucose 4-epimerase